MSERTISNSYYEDSIYNDSLPLFDELFPYSQIAENISKRIKFSEDFMISDNLAVSAVNLLKNLSNFYKIRTLDLSAEKEISIIVSLYSKVNQVNSIYAKYENNSYYLKIFTDNKKYDTELMDRLFNIEDKILDFIEEKSFDFEYIPVNYINPEDVLSGKYYIIYKG
jgi:hypothetical protein